MEKILILAYLFLNVAYCYYAYKKNGIENNNVLLTFGMPIKERLGEKRIRKMVSRSGMVKLGKLYNPRKLEQGILHYQTARLGLIYIILFVGGLLALVMSQDYVNEMPLDYVIERPEFGGGNTFLEAVYQVESDGQLFEKTMPLVIKEQLPEPDEASRILNDKAEGFLMVMLGENVSPDRVTKDLRFIKEPFSEAITVSYSSLSKDVITDRGQLKFNYLEHGQSYPAEIEALFQFGETELTKVYTFTVYKPEQTADEQIGLIPEMVVEESSRVVLPEATTNDMQISWKIPEEGISGGKIFLLTLLGGLVLYILKEQDLNQEIEERQDQILLDFPGVVNKLTILINAGMTLNRAWHKIVTDYQTYKKSDRILYEEMVHVSKELQMGVPEAIALEAFGKRCRSIEVIRLSSILVQNMKRGSHSLTVALKELSVEAWGIRTSNARKLGEKASTKLLIPMAISLVTVLLVVMAPTFMQMQI